MQLHTITESIFHLNFHSQAELASTFLRFQEYYESPHFRGKIFTLEEYKNWYIKTSPKGKKTGEFTYYSDWGGFNFPSEILEPFYQKKFNPISDKEELLLSLFKNKRKKRFYIIGTYGINNLETLKHEISHGLFYTEPSYRIESLNIINEIPTEIREQINYFFAHSGGYHPSVFEDETQAYTLTGKEYFKSKGIKIREINKATKKLDILFNKFFSFEK